MKKIGTALLFILSLSNAQAQLKMTNFYFSWGYNRDWYFAPINIHVKQPSLNNDYKFLKVTGHDKKEVNQLFQHPLTVPQYSWRIGGYFNDKYIFELNFDHTKFVVDTGILLHVKGTQNGNEVDYTINNNVNDSILIYQLNNGANFFLFNVGKKWKWKSFWNGKLTFEPLAKVGIGFMYPHVENTIFKNKNAPHFQLGGINAGIEGDFKMNIYKYFYIEPGLKFDYAYYWGLKVAEGKVSHSLYTCIFLVNFGVNIPLNKNTETKK